MKTFTAADIIPIYCKFLRMTLPEDRNEEALKDNPPRLLRFQQLKSLTRAFDIKGGVNSLLAYNSSGKQENWVTKNYYENLENHPFIIEEYKRISEKGVLQPETPVLHYQERVWGYYFGLAFTIESLKAQKRQINMSIFVGELCIDIIDNLLFSEENQKQIKKVYRMLGLLIDPTEEQVTLKELIELYDFPDVDLVDIDAEYY